MEAACAAEYDAGARDGGAAPNETSAAAAACAKASATADGDPRRLFLAGSLRPGRNVLVAGRPLSSELPSS